MRLPRRFGLWDYIGTVAILSTYYVVEFALDGPRGARWTAPIPVVDQPFRDWIVLDSRHAREKADRISDYFWYASIAYPVVAPMLVALGPRVRSDERLRLIYRVQLLNVQAFSVASLITRLPHKLLGRARPNVIGCESDPEYDAQCGTKGQYVSFFGGHTAISMTGAGLACAHHRHAKLFGGVADDWACGAALAGAGVVFVTRLQSDRHWLSDNIIGSAVGLASGYLIPTLLYYDRRPELNAPILDDSHLELVPVITWNSLGFSVVGWF